MNRMFTGGIITPTWPWGVAYDQGDGFIVEFDDSVYPYFETPSLDRIPQEVLNILSVKEWSLTIGASVDGLNRVFTDQSVMAGAGVYYDNTGGADDTGGNVEAVGTPFASAVEQLDSYGLRDVPETASTGAFETARGPMWAKFVGSEDISGFTYDYDWEVELLGANPLIHFDGMDQILSWSLFFNVAMSLTKTDNSDSSVVYSETNTVIGYDGETFDDDPLESSPALVSGFSCSLAVEEYWTL